MKNILIKNLICGGNLVTYSNEVYTYRTGEKIFLDKNPNQFVIRALPEIVKEKLNVEKIKQVSPSSTRVTIHNGELETLMEKSREIAPTHHAYYVRDTNTEFLLTDRILVTFRVPLSSEKVNDFANRYGLVVREAFSNRDYMFQLTEFAGMNPVKLIVKLTEQEPLVEVAEHDLNRRMKKCNITLPTDEKYIKQWHLHTRFNHSEFDPRSSSRCEEAWNTLNNLGSSEVVVGVTDDGCKMDHIDFNSQNKFASWGYFEGGNLFTKHTSGSNINKMYEVGADHGTSCAGVIAAEVDAELTVGAAPGCRLLPIKWESKGPLLLISDSKMIKLLNYIADKVDVLSNSWGGSPFNFWPLMVIKRITELALSGGRRQKGIVFLWAAGNENSPINHSSSIEVPYTRGWKYDSELKKLKWIGVDTSKHFRNNLVGIPGVMHVAALTSTAQRSHYSNYGTGISISAPSNNVHLYSSLEALRLPVKGLGITTTTGPENSTVTNTFGGTSSATPLVAGIAALVISANPDLRALEVISILKRTASKNLSFEGYPKTPPAVFDPNTSWDVSPVSPFDKGNFVKFGDPDPRDPGDPDGTWSPWFGYGKVDAKAAVTYAMTIRQGGTPILNGPELIANSNANTRTNTNYYIGKVENGNFEYVHQLKPIPDTHFTSIPIVAMETPRDFDFSNYEGKTIIISGQPSNEWTWSTHVIGETNETITDAIKKSKDN